MCEEDPVVEDSIFVFLTDAWGGEDVESEAAEEKIGIGVSSECIDAIFARQDALAASTAEFDRACTSEDRVVAILIAKRIIARSAADDVVAAT